MGETELAELAAAFLAGTLPRERWTHAAHLSVGAWHVHHLGEAAALDTLRVGIRRLNEIHGTRNSANSGYHETITVAYVRLIARFLSTFRGQETLEGRVAALLRSPLAERSLLLRYWSKERLMSAGARAEWLPPDLSPLEPGQDQLPTGAVGAD
jgi:hypothetical protein